MNEYMDAYKSRDKEKNLLQIFYFSPINISSDCLFVFGIVFIFIAITSCKARLRQRPLTNQEAFTEEFIFKN